MLKIKRYLLDKLIQHVEKKEISLIVGPRQAGKTTTILDLKAHLDRKDAKTLFLSLDNEIDRQAFSSQMALVKKIELELGKKSGVVFIDEIQRKEDAGIFLKGIYDMNLPYKFIVTGSGSMELKEKIHESLLGRKTVFELNTVSFQEFVNFKTNYRYEDKWNDFFNIEQEKGDSLLEEYLCFGGYPRVIVEERLEDKRNIINEILTSYLEKDISFLLKVERVDAFSRLMKILAGQIGQIINHSEISSTVGIALPTLKNYLWYAEKTFTINILTPFFRNIRKELSKSPTAYFYDLGFRNNCLGIFSSVANPVEFGYLFQNFVFNILKEKLSGTGARLHFWRTKDMAEVDFVVDAGKKVIPVEVKFKKFKDIQIERSLRNFIEKYKPDIAIIINRNFDKSVKINDTKVIFSPYWKLAEILDEGLIL